MLKMFLADYLDYFPLVEDDKKESEYERDEDDKE